MRAREKPFIIELVGPPGSGKTTLTEAMRIQKGSIRVVVFPYFRDLRYVAFFARSLLLSVPSVVGMPRDRKGQGLTLRDVALMTILRGWDSHLQRAAEAKGTMLVLEEGAICLMAKLRGFGSEAIRGEGADKWWLNIYKRWADTLDVIVRLDAAPATLLQRLRQRDTKYEFDQMDDEQAINYLERIKAAQESVVDSLLRITRKTRLLQFETETSTPEQICREIFSLADSHAVVCPVPARRTIGQGVL